MRSRGDRRGLSPVLGALHMVAVVMLVVSTGVILLGFSEDIRQPPPMAALDESVRVTVNDNETRNEIELVHAGGQAIPAANLEVVVETGDGTTTRPVPTNGSLSDGEWSAGKSVTLSLSEDSVCSGGDKVDVSVVVERAPQRTSSRRRRAPSSGGQFTIGGGSVTPTVNHTANVTRIGTAITARGVACAHRRVGRHRR